MAFLIFTLFLLASLMTPEGVVSTIIGGLVAVGATQWLKKQTGLGGFGATLAAFVVSFVVAMGALVVSAWLSGQRISLDFLGAQAAQIFMLATLAYRLITTASNNQDDDDDTPDLDDANAV